MTRRLFSSQIVDSDAFLDMSPTAQNLYFHLGMRADDDGFVGNPKKILRIVGGNDDDLKILIVKRFILVFESGVVVIKHWLIHNIIRADLYHETQYKKEKLTLGLNENGAYTELRNGISELKQIEAPEWLKRRRKERTESGTTTALKEKLSKEKLSKANIAENPQSWNFKEKLELLLKDKQRHIKIIGIYWQYKGFSFLNKEQYQGALRRDLRAAKNLTGYSNEEIIAVMDWLIDKTDITWKLETVNKFINEDLENIKWKKYEKRRI